MLPSAAAASLPPPRSLATVLGGAHAPGSPGARAGIKHIFLQVTPKDRTCFFVGGRESHIFEVYTAPAVPKTHIGMCLWRNDGARRLPDSSLFLGVSRPPDSPVGELPPPQTSRGECGGPQPPNPRVSGVRAPSGGPPKERCTEGTTSRTLGNAQFEASVS